MIQKDLYLFKERLLHIEEEKSTNLMLTLVNMSNNSLEIFWESVGDSVVVRKLDFT